VLPGTPVRGEKSPRPPPSCSNTADTLQPGAVRHRADDASSVKGLKTDNVTITDGSGQLLWPQATARRRRGRRKQATEASYAPSSSQLNAMLASTLGPGKAQVQVNADMNVDKTNPRSSRTARPACRPRHDRRGEAEGQRATRADRGTGSNIPTTRQQCQRRQLELQPHDQKSATQAWTRSRRPTTASARSTS
jgi:flagellar M-ring protein FliF